MRALLIEDEPTVARAIELMFAEEGIKVDMTDLGEEGLDLGKLYDYDIICLDLNLPDMHGYDVLKKLRSAKVKTPVLILSAAGEVDSKVRALGFGSEEHTSELQSLMRISSAVFCLKKKKKNIKIKNRNIKRCKTENIHKRAEHEKKIDEKHYIVSNT